MHGLPICVIPARNKQLYDLHLVIPGLAAYVCVFSMFVNVPTLQELFLVCERFFFLKKIEDP